MQIKLIASIMLFAVLSACTSLGAPLPGQRVMEEQCMDHELRVCTGVLGSRIKTEDYTTCTCS
jgi:hypothetical protein